MTQNQIRYQQQREEARANRAKELEAHRSNTANETLKAAELQEQQRHYLVGESEQHRSNVVNELETQRAHLANEGLQAYSIGTNAQIAYDNLAENIRAHQTQEAETTRANQAKEQQTAYATSKNAATNILITKMKEDAANQRAKLQAEVTQRGQDLSAATGFASSLSRIIGGGVSGLLKR